MKTLIKTINAVSIAALFLGFLLLLGAAGATDTGRVIENGVSDYAVRGAVIMAAGFLGTFIAKALEGDE